MTWLRRAAVLVAVLFIVSGIGASAQTPTGFARSKLSIETADGSHIFDVELALTQVQQRQGLMFRRQMAADAGMLFYHSREIVASMWMRNTFLPLDMLFVGSDGRIVHIAERTVPQSLTAITAGKPVRAVLEVNAGTAHRLAIRTGDRLIHSLFDNAE